MPYKIIVAGSGTGVGKTVVSSILAQILEADYWKPVESGTESESDTETVRQLIYPLKVHPPAYALKAPLSPHAAAKMEGVILDLSKISPLVTSRPLIIECVGGALVPFTEHTLGIDLFKTWQATFVVVSRHYLGSINHTLLTLEALKQRGIPLNGVIFNGDPLPGTEEAILHFSKVPCLAKLKPEHEINPFTIKKYATLWKQTLLKHLL